MEGVVVSVDDEIDEVSNFRDTGVVVVAGDSLGGQGNWPTDGSCDKASEDEV